MKSATTSGVEFSFNDIIYKQTDGVAMGSPLGPVLANIFVRFYEEKLFSQIPKPSTYFRYVAMIHLLFFVMKKSRKTFLTNQTVSILLSNLPLRKRKIIVYRFSTLTWNEQLPVLKLVCIENLPYWTLLTLGIFQSHQTKNKPYINLVLTPGTNDMIHRALMICTKSKLNEEIKRIKNILLDNGYPESIINSNISKKIASFLCLNDLVLRSAQCILEFLG